MTRKKTNPPHFTPGPKKAKASRDLGLSYIPEKLAILIDGAFLNKKLYNILKRFPHAKEVVDHCQSLLNLESLIHSHLFRIYYYDVPPIEKTIINPINGKKVILAKMEYVRLRKNLIESIDTHG